MLIQRLHDRQLSVKGIDAKREKGMRHKLPTVNRAKIATMVQAPPSPQSLP
jgi:hypothetical protein